MILCSYPDLETTVNEDWLCCARRDAEEVLDTPAGQSHEALNLAARVLALVAEVRRLDGGASRPGSPRLHRPHDFPDWERLMNSR